MAWKYNYSDNGVARVSRVQFGGIISGALANSRGNVYRYKRRGSSITLWAMEKSKLETPTNCKRWLNASRFFQSSTVFPRKTE